MTDMILQDNGQDLRLFNCEKIVKCFILFDPSYIGYDQPPLIKPNEITEQNFELANKYMRAWIPGPAKQEALRRANQIRNTLVQILADCSLLDEGWENVTRERLRAVFETIFCPPIHRIHFAAATKLLHKNRPHLIPIMDSRVGGHFRARNAGPKNVDNLMRAIDKFRGEMSDHSQELECIRNNLQDVGITLSLVRIFDILWWARLANDFEDNLRQQLLG